MQIKLELELEAQALNAAVFGEPGGVELTVRWEDYVELGKPDVLVMQLEVVDS